ncbi:hypothetical protein Ddye_012318 [Dipteronia dyeriana]|uniref:Reverse transcriptase domain-containing protein n=1 Tax=Dipteronia dyeriana TaxID=168575 RepID=A0AAD9X4B8_9ROSI|nr:hypothetical protein Ddye_012318 [Dipteronia dyeriana]
MDKIFQCVQPCLPVNKREFLDTNFSTEDVRVALFDIFPMKDPGPDGLPALFYQKYWSVVGDKITNACLGVLNKGLDLEIINETLVVLIPKVKRAVRISELRPISLYNVVYKIIVKALANHFRLVLRDVISETQSVFISGRLISDNAIVGFECMHALQMRKKGRKGVMALKLDMSKAYDQVEWDFLAGMMAKFGFSDSWIGLIKECIKSVSFSILVNGVSCGHVKPSRFFVRGTLYLYTSSSSVQRAFPTIFCC